MDSGLRVEGKAGKGRLGQISSFADLSSGENTQENYQTKL